MGLGRAQHRQLRMPAINFCQLIAITPQPHRLFRKPITHRSGPADVCPSVHVIANPSGKTVGHRAQPAPVIRPLLGGLSEQLIIQNIARILCAAQRRHGLGVFIIEGNGMAGAINNANTGHGNIPAAGRRSHGLALRRGQQKSRMRGKHHMKQRLGPARGKCGKIRCGRHQLTKGRAIILQPHRSQQINQMVSATQQAFAFKLSNQPRRIGQRQRSRFERAGKIQTELKHRVEQRRLCGLLMQNAQTGTQIGAGFHHWCAPLIGKNGSYHQTLRVKME